MSVKKPKEFIQKINKIIEDFDGYYTRNNNNDYSDFMDVIGNRLNKVMKEHGRVEADQELNYLSDNKALICHKVECTDIKQIINTQLDKIDNALIEINKGTFSNRKDQTVVSPMDLQVTLLEAHTQCLTEQENNSAPKIDLSKISLS